MVVFQRNGDVDPEALAKIVETVGELKGVAMKMGQIMSYVDIALPEELKSALSVLQTHSQPMPEDRVRQIVVEDLGDAAGSLLATLDPVPIAAASIGQVHRATLPDGTAVAVKVQYPEIDTAILKDFAPTAIGTRIASIVYPGAEVQGFIDEARQRFLEECDYEHEARSQARFAELYADHPILTVPAVYPAYCSRRVLCTTFVAGIGFEAFLETEPDQPTRDRIGRALFEFYIGSLFRHRIYNCDPHPGNYLFTRDGRVAMLDYGCTRDFEPEIVNKLVGLSRAVQEDDRAGLHAAFVDLGMVHPSQRYDFDVARGLVRAFYGPMLRDAEIAVDLGEAKQMREVAKAKRQLMKLRLPGEFLFLFRIRFGLMSVLARLGARANWFQLERSLTSYSEQRLR
jgi:predicted unusual protein kinase regulating ubiquinone biosynthesis (AarF/ABC1/UbiB family)